MAVVEGDTCRVLVTENGGKTWSETMHDTDPACSLVNVRMLNETEGWITGTGTAASANTNAGTGAGAGSEQGQGRRGGGGVEGRFWHTTDGGKTWSKEAINGLSIQGLWMEGDKGFAVAVTEEDGVLLLKYRPA